MVRVTDHIGPFTDHIGPFTDHIGPFLVRFWSFLVILGPFPVIYGHFGYFPTNPQNLRFSEVFPIFQHHLTPSQRAAWGMLTAGGDSR